MLLLELMLSSSALLPKSSPMALFDPDPLEEGCRFNVSLDDE